MTLVSASELNALRGVAELGMTTPATIYRRSTVVDADGQHTVWAASHDVTGWLFSEPQPVLTINASETAMVNTYRWFVPVGTDILSGDQISIGGSMFTVSDTNSESTWLPLLRCSLRRVE